MDAYLNKRTALFKKLYTNLENESDFTSLALEIFDFQYRFNVVYRTYVDLLGIRVNKVKSLAEIPFLPVQLYKTKPIKTGTWKEEYLFKSSSTTGQIPSLHYVRDLKVYEQNIVHCFERAFGSLEGYRWYGLLPNYLEQGNSSLVYMVNSFMQGSPESDGGFYLNDYEQLISAIQNDKSGMQKILIGVSFALLDLAESYTIDLSDTMIFETGGMKGRGKELLRHELHKIFKKSFGVDRIYSEYGMTELMSQAYGYGDELHRPSTMRILISDLYDPFSMMPEGIQGRINLIDLANIDSCCFIATDDIGVLKDQSTFTVLGRTDSSEIRGCNILYTG
jgi:hypothetical protein